MDMRTITPGTWNDYEWLYPSSALANLSPSAFMLQHLYQAAVAYIVHDIVLYAIQSFGPTTIATHFYRTLLDWSDPCPTSKSRLFNGASPREPTFLFWSLRSPRVPTPGSPGRTPPAEYINPRSPLPTFPSDSVSTPSRHSRTLASPSHMRPGEHIARISLHARLAAALDECSGQLPMVAST